MDLSDKDKFKLWQARGSVDWRWHCSLRVGGLLVVDSDEQMFYNWDIATGKRVVVKGKCKT
jgi:hypothetical protein